MPLIIPATGNISRALARYLHAMPSAHSVKESLANSQDNVPSKHSVAAVLETAHLLVQYNNKLSSGV
jgi:hypothetical protein